MISIRNLRKVYQQGARTVIALNGVDLDVPNGTIHGIIGQSGAGKSTLVRCLTMLDRPTEGTVSVNGQELSTVSESDLRQARRRIGMVFQHANLLSSRTVLANVAFPLEITQATRAEREEKALELLRLVGLEGKESAYPAQLSGGQRQRVGIARALTADPDVLLFDEPTSALDPNTTNDILELIRSLSRQLSLTVIVITHEMYVVKALCDEVSLLSEGRIIESGRIVDVAENLDSKLSAALLPLPEEFDDAGAESLIEILTWGDQAGLPLSTVVQEHFGVPVRIAAGTIEQLSGVRFAHYLLTLDTAESSQSSPPDSNSADATASPVVTREAVVEYLQSLGLQARIRTKQDVIQAQDEAAAMGGVR